MSEYIRKDKAIKALWFNPSYADPLNVLTQARDVIENIIPADVRPNIHATWEKVSSDKYIKSANYRYRCSMCGELTIGEPNFCPTCGADMRGETRNEVSVSDKSNS